jgi:hypothetical protein
VPSRNDAHNRLFASERALKASILEGEAVLSRMSGDTVYFELLAYLSRANKTSAAVSRQSANFDGGGNSRLAEPARASGLSERDCSH